MRTWLAVAALGLASGCSLLSPEPDPSRFFVLTATTPSESSPVGRGVTVGVGPITLPGYLDRNEIVTRISADELRYSPIERWAEPLRGGIERVVQENLVPLVPGGLVLRFPWAAPTPVDYQVVLDVRRFETDANGRAELVVRWGIRDVQAGTYRAMRDTVLHETGGGADAGSGAQALSRTLADLARQIADEIDRLGPPARGTRPRAQR